MLKNIFQSREDKIQDQVEAYFKEGMQHLAVKFYNGAMVAFDKAMALDPNGVYQKLKEQMQDVAAAGETEAALAVGLNLLKQKSDDYQLANQLGNFARSLKDYKQADRLYKTALKTKKNYKNAFYNLAASSAKVDIYDEAIVGELYQFENQKDFKLPDYIGEKNVIDQLTERIKETKKTYVQEKEQELLLQKDLKKKDNDLVAVAAIDAEIKELKKLAEQVTVDDLINEFRNLIANSEEHKSDHQYNLGLFALSERKTDIALEMLNILPVGDYEHIDLLKGIAMVQKGQLKEAIDHLIRLLGKNEFNRYYNVNLGLMLKKANKKFLSIKYLIKAAYLLKKSNGLYSMKALLEKAHKEYGQGLLKKALNHYKIAATEISDPEIWNNIGTIYLESKKHDEATVAYRKCLKLDSEYKTAHLRLKEIHDYYLEKGEALFAESKYQQAAEFYLKAFNTVPNPETARKAADNYEKLNDIENEHKMRTICKRLIAAEKAKEEEDFRLMLIEKGNKLLEANKVPQAMQSLEAAFVMKVDRDLYLRLAKLYKEMNQKEALESLENRWENMLQMEDQQKMQQKELERKSITKADSKNKVID